jgi:hypothetical protein
MNLTKNKNHGIIYGMDYLIVESSIFELEDCFETTNRHEIVLRVESNRNLNRFFKNWYNLCSNYKKEFKKTCYLIELDEHNHKNNRCVNLNNCFPTKIEFTENDENDKRITINISYDWFSFNDNEVHSRELINQCKLIKCIDSVNKRKKHEYNGI